jgi:hypothetical protein
MPDSAELTGQQTNPDLRVWTPTDSPILTE